MSRKSGTRCGGVTPLESRKTRKARKSVCIGGPIQHAMSNKGFDLDLKKFFLELIQVLENDGYDVFSAHRAEGFGEHAPLDSVTISRRDFEWLQNCDAYVAVLPVGETGAVYRSDGTHMELGWAISGKKPVILILTPEKIDIYSHLVRGMHALTQVEILDIDRVKADPALLIPVLEKCLKSRPFPRAVESERKTRKE